MKSGNPDISFIIVNWNTKQLLLDCLNSIKDTLKDLSFEIWVVDNGSSDNSVEAVKETFPGESSPDIKLIENRENLGFAKANNLALKRISSRYAILLNTDTVLREKAVETMVGFMDKTPAVGICGAQLLNKDGSRQNSIANIPTLATELTNKSLLRRLFPLKYPGKERCFTVPVEVETLVGACMLVRKEAVDEVGLLDEDYFFFLEETDWCLRFRNRGWKVFHHPEAEIFHLQGQSAEKQYIRARVEYWRSRYVFFQKHSGPAARLALRAGLLTRLSMDLLLAFLYNTLTFFGLRRGRRKLKLYATLALWHLAGCPGSWGLSRTEGNH